MKVLQLPRLSKKVFKESNPKPNIIWGDKGRQFDNRSMKSWIEKNDIVMYSIYSEGKSVVIERFFRTLKNKIYKYMISVSKNVYIDKLDDIFNKYNDTYHSTIKMKPADVKSSTYVKSGKEMNNKDSKFKIGHIVTISKYKNVFAKDYFPNRSEKVFVIRKVQNIVLWTYVFRDLNGDKTVRTFYEKELQKTNQIEFRVKKVLKRKDNKLYVKWKGYNDLFNSWTDIKDIV